MNPIALLPLLIGFGLVVVIPVIAIVTSHFQRMAEIKGRHNAHALDQDQRLAALEERFELINEKLNTLILASDRSPYASTDLAQKDEMIERMEPRPRL